MDEVKLVSESNFIREKQLTRFWHLPSRNTNFTGRQDLLDQIDSRLSQAKPVVVTACHGLGGVGKTQLVTEYAYRNHTKYERILWIPAETADQIETAYLLLGQDLKILPDKVSPAEAIHIVKMWLSSHPRNLVIFDNASDYATVQPYVLSAGADVFITSRFTEWPEKGIEVDVFSLDEAVEYFERIVGKRESDTRELKERLATELGWLPLALAQASAYIRENQISIEEYLELYDEKKAILLSQELLPEDDKHPAVFVTWDITMEKIKRHSVLAPSLLNICSFCHSENIPSFLLEPFGEDENFNPAGTELFEEARGYLRSYSMVQVDEQDSSLSVHRLVQELAQLTLDQNSLGGYLTSCFTVAMRCFPHDNLLDEAVRVRALLPHLEALLSRGRVRGKNPVQEGIQNEESIEKNFALPILNALGKGYSLLGNVKKSHALFHEILLITKKYYGEKSIETSTVMLDLGNNYILLGDRESAARCLFEAAEIRMAYSGEDKMPINDTLIYSGIANLLCMCGAFEESREMLEYILPAQEEVLGRRHMFVAATLLGIGQTYVGSHDMVSAKDYLERALDIQKELHQNKANHVIASTLAILGQVYGALGDYQKQKEILEEALSVLEKQYGPESFYLIEPLSGLGNVYQDAADITKRKAVLERALALSEKHYVEESMQTAMLMHQLGCVHSDMNEYDTAKALFKKSLFLQEKCFGSDHGEISSTLTSLGIVYHAMNKLNKAKKSFEQALHIQEKIYGEDHVDISSTLDNFANLESDLGNYERADDYWERILGIKRNYYGHGHPEVALTLFNRAAKNFEASHQFALEAYEMLLNYPNAGPRHSLAQRAAGLFKVVCLKVEPPQIEWIEHYLRENPHDAEGHLSLADFYLSHNSLEKSIFYYEMAIQLLAGDPLAGACHNLGCLYAVKGAVDLAEKQFKWALNCRVLASTHCDYGLFLFNQGRFKEAIENFGCIFDLIEDCSSVGYGELEAILLDQHLRNEILEHKGITVKPLLMAYYWITRCYQRLNQTEEAESYLSRFQQVVESLGEPLYWRLLRYIYEDLGKQNEAEECREMLGVIEFSKQTTDGVAVGQYGLFPLSTGAVSGREFQGAEREVKRCKK